MSRQRIRTVKPDCWGDEAISSCSRDARLLFVVLITFADDDGRFRDLPAAILGHGYPEDEDVTPRKIAAWMSELEATGVVIRYQVAGKPYATFPKWHVHQRINRWTASTLPRCETATNTPIPRHKDDETSLSAHGSITADSVSAHDKPCTPLTERSSPDRECGVGSVEGERKLDTTLRDAVEVVERGRGRASNQRFPVA